MGTYRSVALPSKLVSIWNWEAHPSGETLVTLEFHPVGEEAEPGMTHDLFPDKETRDKHDAGWNNHLDRLSKLL